MKAAAAANRSTAGNRTKGSQTQTLPLKLRRMPMQSRQRYQSECKKPGEVASNGLVVPFLCVVANGATSSFVRHWVTKRRKTAQGQTAKLKTAQKRCQAGVFRISDVAVVTCTRNQPFSKYVRGTSNEAARNNVHCTCG